MSRISGAIHWFKQSRSVEPLYPFQRGYFDRLACLPQCATMDQLGFVQAVDRFCQRIVVAVAGAATATKTFYYRKIESSRRWCQFVRTSAFLQGN